MLHAWVRKLFCRVSRLRWFTRRTEAIVTEDRLTLSGVALVSVMESSKLRNRDDGPAFWLLHDSRLRSVLGQCQMGSGALVQVDNQIPIVVNRESSFIRGIPGIGVLSGFMEPW